ncbi:hypothetical protein PanWU01x14_179530 [Parasponia andersonii]|uniref:Very-long-chain aldehyde decarbonylase CER1-like C-terminal domain-containing protein n=1 Tax=Parasponia andersonii TaxID=3476 RepID=A0A2P5C6U8_PARAD|nr:hypothetical protein PanWU01x14_179530 [Parasponia andersonii]
MSAWRIPGIVHALDGWNEHECGVNTNANVSSFDKVWEATLHHDLDNPFCQWLPRQCRIVEAISSSVVT